MSEQGSTKNKILRGTHTFSLRTQTGGVAKAKKQKLGKIVISSIRTQITTLPFYFSVLTFLRVWLRFLFFVCPPGRNALHSGRSRTWTAGNVRGGDQEGKWCICPKNAGFLFLVLWVVRRTRAGHNCKGRAAADAGWEEQARERDSWCTTGWQCRLVAGCCARHQSRKSPVDR